MKKRNLWGLLLILIGILWLLAAGDMVSVVLAVLTLWPVFFVAAGITLLLKKEARVMRVVVWVIAIALVIGYGIYLGSNSRDLTGGERYIIEMKDGMEHAKMEINTGTANLRTGASDSVLAQVNSDIKGLTYSYSGGGDSIVFSQEGRPFAIDSGRNFFADLNKSVVWDLEFNTGTADGVLDFSGFPLGKCEISGGTCDLRIIAGSLQDATDIECNGALVNLSISIPEGTGIRIKSDALVNNISGNGITLRREGERYESSNYHSADRSINLNVNGVFTHITVDVSEG